MKKNILIITLLFLFSSNLFSQTSNPQQYKYTFTVAKDGSGDYLFIQDAIDAMRVYPLAPITLHIKNGVYNEKIELPANNTDVTFIGENVDSTIIVFNDYSGKGKHTTFTSFTAKISGNRFVAANIPFQIQPGRWARHWRYMLMLIKPCLKIVNSSAIRILFLPAAKIQDNYFSTVI
jgi:pectinesterase